MSALGKKDEEQVAWLIEISDDFTRFNLHLYSGRALNATDFVYSLFQLLEDYKDDPEQLFVEYSQMQDDRH